MQHKENLDEIKIKANRKKKYQRKFYNKMVDQSKNNTRIISIYFFHIMRAQKKFKTTKQITLK